jgi:hypothetical protein
MKTILFYHSNIRREHSFSPVSGWSLGVWSEQWRNGLKFCGSKLVLTTKGTLFLHAMKLQMECLSPGRGNRAKRRGWIDRDAIETAKALDHLGLKQDRAACERLETIESI